MGNCVSASCMEITPKIRVLQAAEGRVVDLEVPISQSSMKVGELMLEFPPGHFVAQLNKADFLTSTSKRAAPLGADADAKPGAVYVLFPMPRMHTRISPHELLSFTKLLYLHEQQLITKAALPPSKAHVHGLFTAGARVAPLDVGEEDDSGADTDQEMASPMLPISFMKKQMSEQDSSSFFIMSSCQGHIAGMIKPKPWAPKLQTIMESS